MSADKPEAIHYLTANGLRFGYLESGEGPLVLLVHGFPDTAYTWDLLRPALVKAGYRTVALFTRGYHPSARPAKDDYGSDTLGADLAAVIRALGESSAVVLGHDFGASAAYSVAAMHPELVRLLITVAIPHPASLKPSLGLLWTLRHFVTLQLPGAARRIQGNGMRHIDELVQRWSPGWDVPAGETSAVKRAFAEEGCLHAALGYYRALRPKPPSSHLKRISVPSVAIAGKNDMIAPTAFEAAKRRFSGDYQVVQMPGSHFMHRQFPEIFEREILKLLAQHPAPAVARVEEGAR